MGCRLERLEIEHPDPGWQHRLLVDDGLKALLLELLVFLGRCIGSREREYVATRRRVNPADGIDVREQLLRLASGQGDPVQRIEIGFLITLREEKYRCAIGRPRDVRDVDIACDIWCRVPLQIGDVQLVVRQAVVVLVDLTRHLQQVGDPVTRRIHPYGCHLLERVDILECQGRSRSCRESGSDEQGGGKGKNLIHQHTR